MDTNVALWCLAAPERLSRNARAILEDPAHSISFSSISVVEFELKRQRLLTAYDRLAADFVEKLSSQGFAVLPYTASDATGLGAVVPNRDPFNRMLSAQAIARNLTLLTADQDLLDYMPLQTLW